MSSNTILILYLNFKKLCVLNNFQIIEHGSCASILEIDVREWFDDINVNVVEEFDKYIYSFTWFPSEIVIKYEGNNDEVLICKYLYKFYIDNKSMRLVFNSLPKKDLNWARLYNLKSFL